MQISSRLTMAIHVIVCIDTFKDEYKVTSDFLAGSVNVNPVVIRRLLGQLKDAGIVEVTRGSGGAQLARPLEQITMLDLYHAVECVDDGELFHFHEKPNPKCPVGKNIHNVLDDKLDQVQKAMEDEMSRISMKSVIEDTKKFIAAE
ncbi:MAG: Rrf2 family transcriptional regulator [bacterium]|nr:Rrf2 family transcriptional regulator [bacterium]